MDDEYKIQVEKLKEAGIDVKEGARIKLRLNDKQVVTSEIVSVDKDFAIAKIVQ